MVKRIDSDALGVVNRSLGLTGAGSQITELADGVVDQVLSVNELARRGRTLAGTEGLFIFRLRNVHGAASSLSAILNPFAAGTALVHAPYPSPLPAQFDLWLLSAQVNQPSGSGTLSGVLFINYPGSVVGAGVDDSGAVVAQGVTSHAVAFWDALATESVEFGVLSGANGPRAELGIRLPRATTLQLVFASTSSALATFECLCVMGVFPLSLGQDGIG